jgi:alpha-tubulin suppressor-like RCC1 family protein
MAAIQDNGTLWACGYNGRGEVGNGVLGGTISTMVQVGSSTAWRQVMYTYYGAVDANAFGIQQDGSLWGWGFGLLSNIPGYTTDQPAPVQIGTETNWRQVGSSKSGLFAIKTDGTLWSWGSQFWGALGDSVYAGGGTNQSSPAQIGTLKTWKQLAWSGSNIGQHFAAIKDGYD